MTTSVTTTITTVSGSMKALPAGIDPALVAGLDRDGRIVVDNFGARTKPVVPDAPFSEQPFLFALTLCCNATDTGTDDGSVCRGCYSEAESGEYLFRASDGSFPGLDPVTSIA